MVHKSIAALCLGGLETAIEQIVAKKKPDRVRLFFSSESSYAGTKSVLHKSLLSGLDDGRCDFVWVSIGSSSSVF